MNISVDLNCDMGEGFGPHDSGLDEKLMKYITSANIACGFHAGDFTVMQRTVMMAKENGVAVGAHPSFPDLQGFGRRVMSATPNEVYEMTLYQIGALYAFTKAQQIKLHHVKPHGALYNLAAKDRKLADAIVHAIADFDRTLILYGLANSAMIESSKSNKLPFCEEVFADRTYQADGALTPRTVDGALIENSEEAVKQVMQMIETKSVTSVQQTNIAIEPGTICIHGDGVHAVEFAQAIHNRLKLSGVQLASPS